jgi:hypothetical protein
MSENRTITGFTACNGILAPEEKQVPLTPDGQVKGKTSGLTIDDIASNCEMLKDMFAIVLEASGEGFNRMAQRIHFLERVIVDLGVQVSAIPGAEKIQENIKNVMKERLGKSPEEAEKMYADLLAKIQGPIAGKES